MTKQFIDKTETGVPIIGWLPEGIPIEQEALVQLKNLTRLPFLHKHVAVMPDVHAGKGSTIGSVIVTKGAIVPAAVGVDIGCGMMALKTNLRAKDLPDNLSGVRSAIEKLVPHGRTNNGGPGDRGAFHDVRYRLTVDQAMQLKYIKEMYPKLSRSADNCERHLGTLGTGNHFVELCLDENQDVWIMLHSGSRGIGNAIGTQFIELAKEDMRRFFINLPDKDLAYIPEGSEVFKDYMIALKFAQGFARSNREFMMLSTIKALEESLGTQIAGSDVAINCHHNYANTEHHYGSNVMVTRKGAVRSREGDLGIIPGSMGAKSFIVRGKGNPESFCSCSHGAGRTMSRTKAKAMFTVEDHMLATEGVECRKDAEVIDETPMAYKSIDLVMKAQEDLVDIVHTLKQVVCVKG